MNIFIGLWNVFKTVFFSILMGLIVVLLFCLFLGVNPIASITADRSATFYGEQVTWNDITFTMFGEHYTQPHTYELLSYTQDGATIDGFNNDPNYTYIMVSSFLDNYVLVRSDYKKIDRGVVTAIALRGNYVKLTDDRLKIKDILFKTKTESNRYKCTLDNSNDLNKVEYSYNQSLVTDNFYGYITYSKEYNRWLYIDKISEDDFNLLYKNKKATIDCYLIDHKFTALFNNIDNIYRWFHDETPRHVSFHKIK
ncbi:hypothetical protein OUO06_20235 (plasmid) [Photobacterium damselae]|uniref:hypothetical protein n=1 Tax=Photobacterium damselae TaxID=38293 RepID=UPI003C6E3651